MKLHLTKLCQCRHRCLILPRPLCYVVRSLIHGCIRPTSFLLVPFGVLSAVAVVIRAEVVQTGASRDSSSHSRLRGERHQVACLLVLVVERHSNEWVHPLEPDVSQLLAAVDLDIDLPPGLRLDDRRLSASMPPVWSGKRTRRFSADDA